MRHLIHVVLLTWLLSLSVSAQAITKIATWNMEWLGATSGNQLDAVDAVKDYASIIQKTQASLLFLQEIGATHSLNNQPRCHYLDLIVDHLNEDAGSDAWVYVLDDTNRSQRLAYLYDHTKWTLEDVKTIKPGPSFNYIRRPLVAKATPNYLNAESLHLVNIHFKAFNDQSAKEKRQRNFEELANYLRVNNMEKNTIIAGDTNLFEDNQGYEQPLVSIEYTPVDDPALTAIYKDELSQRFDRFYYSKELADDVQATRDQIHEEEIISTVSETACNEWFSSYYDTQARADAYCIAMFGRHISDHVPVVFAIKLPGDEAMQTKAENSPPAMRHYRFVNPEFDKLRQRFGTGSIDR